VKHTKYGKKSDAAKVSWKQLWFVDMIGASSKSCYIPSFSSFPVENVGNVKFEFPVKSLGFLNF
jgi:hypothetical protein